MDPYVYIWFKTLHAKENKLVGKRMDGRKDGWMGMTKKKIPTRMVE